MGSESKATVTHATMKMAGAEDDMVMVEKVTADNDLAAVVDEEVAAACEKAAVVDEEAAATYEKAAVVDEEAAAACKKAAVVDEEAAAVCEKAAGEAVHISNNCKHIMGLALKFFFNVLLPIVDVISDVYFTWDVYTRGEIKYFTTSGIFFNSN